MPATGFVFNINGDAISNTTFRVVPGDCMILSAAVAAAPITVAAGG